MSLENDELAIQHREYQKRKFFFPSKINNTWTWYIIQKAKLIYSEKTPFHLCSPTTHLPSLDTASVTSFLCIILEIFSTYTSNYIYFGDLLLCLTEDKYIYYSVPCFVLHLILEIILYQY